MRAHQGLVGGGLHLLGGDLDVPLQDSQRRVGLVHYIGKVAVPLEVTRDGYSKVLGVVHYLKCVTSQGIGCLNNFDLSLLGNPENLAFLRMKLNLPEVSSRSRSRWRRAASDWLPTTI